MYICIYIYTYTYTFTYIYIEREMPGRLCICVADTKGGSLEALGRDAKKDRGGGVNYESHVQDLKEGGDSNAHGNDFVFYGAVEPDSLIAVLCHF